VLADLEDLDNVGMLKTGDRLGLGAEACQGLGLGCDGGPDQFQGDNAIERHLPCLVNDTHTAASQLAQDIVTGDQRRPRRVDCDGIGGAEGWRGLVRRSSMQCKQLAHGIGQVGKAVQIFIELRRFAGPFAQDHFSMDQA